MQVKVRSAFKVSDALTIIHRRTTDKYLGAVLPYAVMAMLVVYCLKGAMPLSYPYGLPELIGVLATAGLHLYKRNTLLSIAGGTAVYMLMVQCVFV